MATEVIAISTDQRLELAWHDSEPGLPLVIVQAANGDRAVAVLKQSEQAAQVSLVVPRGYSW